MNNEKNNTTGSRPWNGSQSLGFSVLQRHKKVLRQQDSDLVANHLGRDRISLAADINIYRRYNRSNSSAICRADFPLFNFFSQASLQSLGSSRKFSSQNTPLRMNAIHRLVDAPPHNKPHIGMKRGLAGVNIPCAAISLAANENSSVLISPSKSSDQSFIVAPNSAMLKRVPNSSYMQAHISKPVIVRRRTGGGKGRKSSHGKSFLIAKNSNTNKGNLPGLVQRVVGRQSQKRAILSSVSGNSGDRFTLLDHNYVDDKMASMADSDFELAAINAKAEPSSGLNTRQQQISTEAGRSGSNRLQNPVQRAIVRQDSGLAQKHYESRDNNIYKGKAAAFSRSAPGAKHTSHFASPLEHSYHGRKTVSVAVSDSGLSAINAKAELSSEMNTRQQQISTEADRPGSNRLQSLLQRAIVRQDSGLAQKHYEFRDNNIYKGKTAAFSRNAPGAKHISHFVSPLVTVSRKFALSSDSKFEGLGTGRKIAEDMAGVSSEQGPVGGLKPVSAIAKFFPPDDHNYVDDKMVSVADSDSGLSAISTKAEPSSGLNVRQQQILTEVGRLENNLSQSSMQRAVARQNNIPADRPRPAQSGMWDMRLNLKTALRKIEPGYKLDDSVRRSANIVSRYGENTRFDIVDPLLTRSVASSSKKINPLFQVSLGRQLQDTVSRKNSHGHGQRDITTRHVEASEFSPVRAISFVTVAGNLTPGTIQQPSSNELSESAQAINSAMRLPLAQPIGIQRKSAVSVEQRAAGVDMPGYMQRVASNDNAVAELAAPIQAAETASTQTDRSKSNSSSTDDIVDKVWRKLMRKLVSEQEKMGGSSRWAH
ncbi:hypothetical protein [Nitrosomonas sp.]|uniref:hypothetical protein n=1 Tax=Nitrosomonas sp. TaxID=42353 RepID=UPI0025E06C50|nr:hypothetical protein [Nitrosomonas sp.]